MKTKDYITLTISIVAILLSLSNFYFQYFRIIHSLKVTVNADLSDWSSKEAQLIVKGVIANYGNRTEVVNSGQVFIGDKHDLSRLHLSKLDPLVLKPGEAIAFNLTDSIVNAIEDGGEWNEKKDSLFLKTFLLFTSTSANGTDCYTNIKLGTFCYFEPSDYFTMEKDLSNSSNWKELIH